MTYVWSYDSGFELIESILETILSFYFIHFYCYFALNHNMVVQ